MAPLPSIEWLAHGDLALDIDDVDWPPLPVETGFYRGAVLAGRHSGGPYRRWLVRLTSPAEM